jgi:hypothetical protein
MATIKKAQNGAKKGALQGAKDLGKYVSTFGLATEKKSNTSPKKTGMDALKDLGKYISTGGLATEKYNPAPSTKAKKKMKNGGSLTGLKAPNTRDKGIDPNGPWTKVQKKTLAGAKGKASLTKDKKLGATKMKSGGCMSCGGKMAKKK